ncbi:O-antigen ligase family protein [Calothrix rhizosoleniae]|uniref:O-antigen ligase family protein n=1 Tax=Calothrix rhizosoleniae TaxID=888997 RepID=UPI000B4975F7|nr:O-antigen ligase family protein [Calothrix rhizosoleniae]
MSLQAQLVMLLWLPVVLYLFTSFTAQRAVIISFIAAWLFLPQNAGFSVLGLPDYERMSATCYGILLATFIFDVQRFRSFQFNWLDLPMLIWCLCPFASSMSNDLGAYDGLAQSLQQTVSYGIPYFLGRIYLNNLIGFRHLAIAIFTSGLIYAPFCLYESRMSPVFHQLIYGYVDVRAFAQGFRYGSFRPTVFMEHGLAVGMWMMAATLIGIWLWQTGVVKQIWGIPIMWLVIGLLFTFILVRSTGAYLYLLLGCIILFVAKKFRTALVMLLVMLAMSSYLYMGATGVFNSERIHGIVSALEMVVEPGRASSLGYRMSNEELLSEKARHRPIFGWGGWGRNRILEENWEGELVDVAITDSLWIIAFGINGTVGLIALFSSSLLPSLSFFWLRYPARFWFKPEIAPAALLSVVITLYMLDCTLNNMPNPVFTLASGGIAGLALNKSETKKLSNHSSLARQPSSVSAASLKFPRINK